MTALAWARRRPARWIALALVAVNLLVYWQVRSFEFINFDDEAYVAGNPHVNQGLTREGLVWAFVTFDFFYWHPLTWLSHMLDCQLFGLRAGPHHFTNVLLHIANALLVFFVFRRMTGAVWRSAVVAGLFALHPLRVESVSWVAERKDVLSGLWLMITLWAYVRYTERPGNTRYGLVLLAMLMGLMSKPMLVTVPVLLLLVDYWPLGRRPAILEKLPMLMLAGASAVLTTLGQHRMGAVAESIPVTLRISNALVSYARYIGKTIWPERLAIFYPYPISIPAWQAVGAALLLAMITAAVLWAGRSRRYLAAGWLWFVLGLLPTIGLVQAGQQAMADRFTYLPLIGLFAAAVWGAAALLRQHSRLAASAAGVVLAACLVISWAQTRTWRDSVTVFEHAAAVTQNNRVAHRHLALAFEERGRTDLALAHFAEAVRVPPNRALPASLLGYFISQYQYGDVLLAHGEPAAAAKHFSEAIQARPDFAEGHYRLAEASLRLGRRDRAAAHLREALRLGLSPRDQAGANRTLAAIAVE